MRTQTLLHLVHLCHQPLMSQRNPSGLFTAHRKGNDLCWCRRIQINAPCFVHRLQEASWRRHTSDEFKVSAERAPLVLDLF